MRDTPDSLIAVDTLSMPWSRSPSSAVLKKQLRFDEDTGASCIILKAPPRLPGTSRPHFHDGKEEIVNLGPVMQFDEGAKLGVFGYVRYAPGRPHGADVRIPHGYHLLVRSDGLPNLQYMDVARDGPQRSPYEAMLPSFDQGKWKPSTGEGTTGRVDVCDLDKTNPFSSFYMRLTGTATAALPYHEAPLELFVLQGTCVLPDETRCKAGTYICAYSGLKYIRSENALIFIGRL